MGNEAVVHILVDTRQVIHAVAAIGSAAGRYTGHIRLCLNIPCRRKVILHVKADVVSGDFLAPGLTKGRSSTAVGQHHHITLMSHKEIIPAVAPALRQRTLGTAQANLNGRIRLGGIELGRIQHPGKHLLTIHRSEPAGLGLMLVQLSQQVLVFKRDLTDTVVGHSHQLRGEIHGSISSKERSVLQHAERRTKVKPQRIRSEPDRFLSGNHVEDTLNTLCEGGKVDGLAVGRPDGAVHIIFKGSRQLANASNGRIGTLPLLRSRVHHISHHKAHLVGLITVTGHGKPQKTAAVRAPHRMRIIAAPERHLRRFSRERTINEDTSIGRESVLLARKLLAAVGDVAAVGAPGKVCHITERTVGQFKKFSVQNIHTLRHYAVSQRCHKTVVDIRAPVIPVTVHQVLGGIGLGLVQHGVCVGRNLHAAVHGRHIQQLALIRRKQVVVNALFHICQLHAAPQHAIRPGRLVKLPALKEIDGAAVLAPAGR